jgi:Zn-dependent M28 family amino/carboxypeptidase
MKRIASILLLFAVFASFAYGQNWTAKFDPNTMRARVKRLSADDFEGRGPGTEGGKRAAQYIADQLKASGVLPANNGSYFQNVKLVGLKADHRSSLTVQGKSGLQNYSFGNDFVATTGAQTGEVAVNSEIVFLGYGIDAPLYNWNDYKGAPDQYKGKVLMIMVNDPPATEKEPNLFGGKALTYYGRWTYKYEEAARKGAAGVILIHSDESAGYGWNVVRTSNGNWRYEIARSPSDTSPFLSLKSWVTESTARNILNEAKLDLDQLRERAKSRDFRPVTTGLTVKLNLKSELKTFESPNVVGKVEGSDAGLNKEFVVFSAHWDHLGIGEPNDKGDRIYNGAYDNASGVAAVLGIAEVLAKTPRSQRPKRSFLFLFPTAEEQGLLGAEYYSQHPLVPLPKTVADINLDGVNFFGKVSDMMALGSERSTIEIPLASAAKERNLTLQADARPEQGFFFRSDHFPFARVGVPSINLQHGDAFIKPLSAEAEGFFKDYNAKYYHQVTDEYHDWWDMSAMIQEAEFALAVGAKIANTVEPPKFKPSDEFSAADQKRFK